MCTYRMYRFILLCYYVVFHRIMNCQLINECDRRSRFSAVHEQLASTSTIISCSDFVTTGFAGIVKCYRFRTN